MKKDYVPSSMVVMLDTNDDSLTVFLLTASYNIDSVFRLVRGVVWWNPSPNNKMTVSNTQSGIMNCQKMTSS